MPTHFCVVLRTFFSWPGRTGPSVWICGWAAPRRGQRSASGGVIGPAGTKAELGFLPAQFYHSFQQDFLFPPAGLFLRADARQEARKRKRPAEGRGKVMKSRHADGSERRRRCLRARLHVCQQLPQRRLKQVGRNGHKWETNG